MRVTGFPSKYLYKIVCMQVGSMLDMAEKKEKNPRTHTRKVITKTVKSKRIMNYIA